MKFLASSALPSSLSPPPVDDQLARRRLELNAPKTEDDSTVRALASFLDFLPNEGRHPLSQFVSGCSNATLYSLAEYLISSILIPSESRNCLFSSQAVMINFCFRDPNYCKQYGRGLSHQNSHPRHSKTMERKSRKKPAAWISRRLGTNKSN